MTKETRIAELSKLKAEVTAMVANYNEAIATETAQKMQELDDDMTKKINEYTSIVKVMCYEDCKATDNPMVAAVKMLSFVTIGVKDEEIEDDGNKIMVRTIEDKVKPINLADFHKYVKGNGIGANSDWLHIVQKMNYLLTAQKCKDLGVDPKAVNDSYAMTEIAAKFDMGKNPTSNTNLLKTLQFVVTAMLGDDYKATSHDVNFLLSVYSKKNRKALTVTCANHRFFLSYIAEVCHRIVTGKSYDVSFKAKKA